MAKHARPDDEKPWIGPVGMVYCEEWSGKFWRKGINQYAYVGEPGDFYIAHYNHYDSYEEMPVGSVVVVSPLYGRVYRKARVDGIGRPEWEKI